MNKTAIKNFAVWARNKLIAEITYKAVLLGITEKEIKSPLPQSTQSVKFFDVGTKEPYSITGVEIEQRKKLVKEIETKASQSDYNTAYQSLVEEVAYTWFNRLIAVRFMEVNDYIPTRIRVLSSESSTKSEPDLVTNPMDADLDYTPYEKDRIMQLKNDNQLDELFRMLFSKQCNALNTILPALFEKTNDFTEILMNVSFTDQDGVVYHLIHDISEDDFNVSKEGQVEIIGWMYQYYNTEPKAETFALLKKNVKITKERIPAATQLFTPDWIVRYMVENSLGHLWLEGHPNDALKSEWKYYLDEVEQEADVQIQLNDIRKEYRAIKPEDIKVIDPCMGSGHILVYAFDVLMQIYESCGYSQRDAAESIVENNIYGLDIDNRAYQLAYFAVMMKARQYNRRILNRETACHVYAIQESNGINCEQLKYFGGGMSDIEKNSAMTQVKYLLDTMQNAKEYGSILNVNKLDWNLLYHFIDSIDFNGQITLDDVGVEDTQKQLRQLVEIAVVMEMKYDVVVTNPPYMGSGNMGSEISELVKKNYTDSKSDLFAVFIERSGSMLKKYGFQAMITMQTWMFLSSYEKLREKIIAQNILSLLQFGIKAFEEIGNDIVQTAAFVIRNTSIPQYSSTFFRLLEHNRSEKEEKYLQRKNMYITKPDDFKYIPGRTIAYWLSEKMELTFLHKNIASQAKTLRGYATASGDIYIRKWYEVDFNNIAFSCKSNQDAVLNEKKWFLYNKGGFYRKWYGNNEEIVNYQDSGKPFKNIKGFCFSNQAYYFQESITWTKVCTGRISLRYNPKGFIFGDAGPALMANSSSDLLSILGFLNSKLANSLLSVINPTLNFTNEAINNLPMFCLTELQPLLNEAVKECIAIMMSDWDSFELSWGFKRHPFVNEKVSILEETYRLWCSKLEDEYSRIWKLEERINDIVIQSFDLVGEPLEALEDRDICIRRPDINKDMIQFISYAVGCMLGRYSLNMDGLAYAGGEWDNSKYSTFIPDKDNILPITDEEYFEDDVVELFCTFLKKTFGTETLEENLDFIAKALANKGSSSREIIRNYFLKDFFKDHCKIYKKRPIYWLFDSGKADGFKALVYTHRYNEDTIGNLRIDYLHRMQRVYEREISRMQEIIENSNDTREMTTATKRKEKLVKQLKETKEYDEKIAHLALARINIDLDDGVKINYEKVQTDIDGKKLEVLAKI